MIKAKKKKTASKPKLEVVELEAAKICSSCDDYFYKSIDVKMAMCDSCNRIGCEHFVSNDYGTGHCIGKFGCAAERKGIDDRRAAHSGLGDE